MPAGPTTRLIHPGEGGYDEALAEWDLQQHGGETIPAHQATKMIGDILADLE